MRADAHTGPLPAPVRSAPALRALDDALLHAAEVFDQGRGGDLHTRPRLARLRLRAALGSAGREYGLRVALSFGAAAAVAQALHRTQWYGQHDHWYWLPATAVFLVKPDLGPLASRVLNRAAGTVLGALLFAGLATVLPRPEGLVALVALSGALIPVATRHFAAQTAVVLVLVLALVMVGGEPQASAGRIGETLLACVIVLLVGHLTMPGQKGGGVRGRLTAAADAAYAYLAHVLAEAGAPHSGPATVPADHDGPRASAGARAGATPTGRRPGPPGPHTAADDRAARWTLRREAYRTLAEALSAITLAAHELPAVARHTEGADEVADLLERLVDTTTACAVHLDDTGRIGPGHTERLTALLGELAGPGARLGLRLPRAPLAG